jgi:hypothetical protein
VNASLSQRCEQKRRFFRLHVERLEDRCLLSHVPAADLPDMLDPNLGVRPVATGLTTPTSIAFLGSGDMFVLEKDTGKVQRVVGGAIQSTVLDLAVNNASERGLLGIALHPDFEDNGFVYLFWTARTAVPPTDPFFPDVIRPADVPALGADTNDVLSVPLLGNRVDRFVWDGTSLAFDQNLIMLRAFQNDGAPLPAGQGDAAQPPLGNHDGGVITFGKDGKLYIIIGDVGRRGQLQNLPSGPTETGLGPTVQDDQFGGPEPDDAHFTGVIIRLNDDGTTPEDNPFFDVGAEIGGEVGANIQRMFAYGIRNSFGLAIDPFSGRLWATENGDDSFDELNLVAPGFNSGWIQIMGPLARFAQFKQIETTFGSQSLQQLRWSPEQIADSRAEAVDRLFELAGSRYSDPEFSWKFAVPPTALDFVESRALGSKLFRDLIVGNGAGQLMQFDLTGNRRDVQLSGRGLRDRVDDNSAKFVPNESRRLIIGEGFGIITDVESGPNGRLYVSSIEHGTVYEVFPISQRTFNTSLSGSQEVPPRSTPARGNTLLRLNRDSDELFFQITVSNIRNVVAAHLHLGQPGVNGPIVASLYSAPAGGGRERGLLVRGTIRAADLEGPLAGHSLDELIGELLDGNIYVNVHTNDGVGDIDTGPGDFPGGEIRGQFRARR